MANSAPSRTADESDGKADTENCISAVKGEAVNADSVGHNDLSPEARGVGNAPFRRYPTEADGAELGREDPIMTYSHNSTLMDTSSIPT